MVRYICLYCKKEFDRKWSFNCHTKSCENKFNKIINKYKSYTKESLIKEYNNAKIKYDLSKLSLCEKIKYRLNLESAKKMQLLNANNVPNQPINNILEDQPANLIISPFQFTSYDQIKYSSISELDLKRAFKVPGEAFQFITLITFFDPDIKSNHIIYCPNLKDKHIHVHNGYQFSYDGWTILDKKKFFKDMILKQIEILERVFISNQENGNPLQITNPGEFIGLMQEFAIDNELAIKKYTDKLNTLCYKNSPIIKVTLDDLKKNRNLIH